MSKSFSTQQDVNSILEQETALRQEFIDTKIQGLKLIKRKNGSAKWSLTYIYPKTARPQTYKIGLVCENDLQSARLIALELIEREYPAEDIDVLRRKLTNTKSDEEKNSKSLLVKDFVRDYYLPFIISSKRSYQTDVSLLNNHILPALGSKELQNVTAFDVEKMI